MISWIRIALFFTVFTFIVGGFIAGPVIKGVQAENMNIQMQAAVLSEAPISMEQDCKSCIGHKKIEHCSSLCSSSTTAILENKPFDLTKIPNALPIVTLMKMLKYTPSVEPDPPRI